MSLPDLPGELMEFYRDIAIFVSVPVLAGTVAAFIVATLQAVTQINEQTLPQTVKIATIAVVLLLFGTALSKPLYLASERAFTEFAAQSQP